MGILIKEADLDKDKDILIQTLNENRRIPLDEERYVWLYKKNPYGNAKVWLVIDEDSGEVAGFTCALPRAVKVENQEVICWNCGDFSINKKYRTLGVAIKLRKAAKECVDKGIVPFLYAHPNDKMLVVHLKVGHTVIGKMFRYAKLLKLDSKIEDKWGKKFRWVSKIINPMMKWTGTEIFRKRIYEFTITRDRFGDEFNAFFDEVKGNYPVIGVRSAKYLNWRFIEHPLYNVETIILKKNTSIVGYLIFITEAGIVHIKDFLYLTEEAGMELLSNLIIELRKREVYSISAGLLNTNPFINILKRFGFSLRPDSSSVIVHPNSSFEFADLLLDGSKWFMTVGDRDV
ncbi:MAG: hypothetical protein AB1414_01950 [bacterium]